MFGQRSRIAHAVISRVIHGNPVHNRDPAGLAELYYTISDCMVTLQRLNYVNDLYSTDVLRQACQRLPQHMFSKWAEHCLYIRRNQEPTLEHLEAWLQDRVRASKESYLPDRFPMRATNRDQPTQRRNSYRENEKNKRSQREDNPSIEIWNQKNDLLQPSD